LKEIPKGSVRIYAHLLSYTWPYRLILAGAVVALIVHAAADTGFIWLMQPLLDGSFVERNPVVIRTLPVVILALFVVRGLSGFCSTYGMAYISRHVIKTLRKELFDHLLMLPSSYYDSHSSGQLISKLIYNVEQVAQAASSTVIVIIRDLFTVLGLLGLMFYLNWQLTLVIFLIGPLIGFLIRYVSIQFRRISTRLQHSMGDVTQSIEESIEGHKLIKLFGGFDRSVQVFESINEHNRRLHMRLVATRAASSPIVQFIVACAVSLIVFLATRENAIHQTSPGEFVSFIGAMVGILAPLRHLTNVNETLQKGIAAAESIFSFMDESLEADHGTIALERAQGRICYQNIVFTYSGKESPALNDVSLNIEVGMQVALVGPSGSGKSTMAQLLPRFYDPQQGKILLDGRDIRDYRLNDLRRQISYITQEVVLFNDTIAANVAYGSHESIDTQKIINALELSCAWEFVKELPDGIETVVGDKGIMLSGGQRQRLAIARALVKNAPILILDEATSALDTVSERQVQQALHQVRQGRTSLIIAHRLSTIVNADLIAVLWNGRIVESGTHNELLRQNGAYTRLYRTQLTDTSEQTSAHLANMP